MEPLKDHKLADITQDLIQDIVNKEAKSHSPKSVRDLHGLISAVMRTERPDLRLNTQLPQKVRPDIYVPSDAEITRLMDFTDEKEIKVPIMPAAYCGMRRGEVAALQSEDISNGMIHVQRTMVETPDYEWTVKAPKSYAGDRFVPVPNFVLNALPATGDVTTLNPTMISQRFSLALKSSGIHTFRFHDLRHPYVKPTTKIILYPTRL